jgi:hypothetical protein
LVDEVGAQGLHCLEDLFLLAVLVGVGEAQHAQVARALFINNSPGALPTSRINTKPTMMLPEGGRKAPRANNTKRLLLIKLFRFGFNI